MSKRLNIPSDILRAVANKLIEQPKTPPRGKSCPTKLTILRRSMKASPDFYAQVVKIAREFMAAGVRTEAAKDGFVIRPTEDAAPIAKWFESMSTEERRSYRLVLAQEFIRGQIAGDCSSYGGKPTTDELETAKRILDGDLEPNEWLLEDCDDKPYRTEPGTLPKGFRESPSEPYRPILCSDPRCPIKTNGLGHLVTEIFAEPILA